MSLTRRNALTGAAAVAAGTPLLAACGTSGGGSSATEPAAKSGQTLGPAADVPVGGGKIYADQRIVVTQPSKGTFEGFSAICTHQGCLVSTVTDGTINCTCHGSKFSIQNGSVENGPATSPLARVQVQDDGGQIVTA
jgi:Rieske Fe-S protein